MKWNAFKSKLFCILFVGVSCLLSSVSWAQNELKFDESGYNAVLERSKNEHKPIFYMLYATWCTHCNKMKSEVFKDSTVTKFMNTNFICAGQDAEKGEGAYFKNRFGILNYPTFILMDEKGIELYNFSGEYKVTPFLSEMNTALNPEKQLPYLQRQFEAEPNNSDKCLAYLYALNRGRDRRMIAPVAKQYLATQQESQLISANNWKIIANGVTDIQSREFQYVLKHQKEFETVASPKRVERKIINIVNEMLTPYMESKDSVAYASRRMIAKSIALKKVDSLVFVFDISIAEKSKNWTAYKKTTEEGTAKYVYKDAKTLLEISRNYLNFVADSNSLKNAIQWALQAIELNETYDAEIIVAKLYQKTNDLEAAKSWANKAKTKNAAFGWSTKDADELLLQLATK